MNLTLLAQADVATPWIEQALKLNDKLLGLPAIPLIVLACICVGGFCKWLPAIPNGLIPTIILLVSVLANCLIAPLSGAAEWTRAILYGFVCAFAAVFIYRKWIRKYVEDDPPPLSVILLPFVLAGLVVGSGCASTPGKLIASSSSTVDHAMQAWMVYVVDGHATPEQSARVREAQAQYYSAEDAAIAALTEFKATGDKTTWQRANDYLREQQQNLLALVSGFTGKALP